MKFCNHSHMADEGKENETQPEQLLANSRARLQTPTERLNLRQVR